MSKLTADRVEEIFVNCLYLDEELEDEASVPEDAVLVEGISMNVGFHPDRLDAHKPEIFELLKELPDQFMSSKGGGWSFLNACMDKHDNHWAEHPTIDKLLILGIAIGKAGYLMEREYWKSFPGGAPYFYVRDTEADKEVTEDDQETSRFT